MQDLRENGGAWIDEDTIAAFLVNPQPSPWAHFATFPLALIEPCILAGCRPGGVVLDPFIGSGTTAVVAKGNGRHYLGAEINAEYIRIARERLRQPFERHHVIKETKLEDLPLFKMGV